MISGGDRTQLICFNLLNIRSEIKWKSLSKSIKNEKFLVGSFLKAKHRALN